VGAKADWPISIAPCFQVLLGARGKRGEGDLGTRRRWGLTLRVRGSCFKRGGAEGGGGVKKKKRAGVRKMNYQLGEGESEHESSRSENSTGGGEAGEEESVQGELWGQQNLQQLTKTRRIEKIREAPGVHPQR